MTDETALPLTPGLTDEALTPQAGPAPAHEPHAGLRLGLLADDHLPPPENNRGYCPSTAVLPLVLTLLAGGRDLEDMVVIANDRAAGVGASTCEGESASLQRGDQGALLALLTRPRQATRLIRHTGQTALHL